MASEVFAYGPYTAMRANAAAGAQAQAAAEPDVLPDRFERLIALLRKRGVRVQLLERNYVTQYVRIGIAPGHVFVLELSPLDLGECNYDLVNKILGRCERLKANGWDADGAPSTFGYGDMPA